MLTGGLKVCDHDGPQIRPNDISPASINSLQTTDGKQPSKNDLQTADGTGPKTSNEFSSNKSSTDIWLVNLLNLFKAKDGFQGVTPNGDVIFEITLDPETGEYTFTLLGPIDHPDSTDPNGYPLIEIWCHRNRQRW